MPSLKRRLIIPTTILLSVLLSGCQFGDELTITPATQQVKNADKSWTKQSDTYSITTIYGTPGGEDSNTFHLTIQNGIIKNVVVDVFTDISESIRYQQRFASSLPQLITGKKLSDITSLDIVSGASLTTASFNEAIKKLQQQLKS